MSGRGGLEPLDLMLFACHSPCHFAATPQRSACDAFPSTPRAIRRLTHDCHDSMIGANLGEYWQRHHELYMEASINGGTPIAGLVIMENPIKMDDDWGYPYFRKPSYIFKYGKQMETDWISTKPRKILGWARQPTSSWAFNGSHMLVYCWNCSKKNMVGTPTWLY